ncbi:MAG TPA: DUF2975 domain-containing protein [Azospirillaceae bacterium]|nr:DUF2975 domain-containing protein [Azospirillaceae bacterium]
MSSFPAVLTAFRRILVALRAVNLVFAAAVAAGLLAWAAAPAQLAAMLGAPGASPSVVAGFALFGVIGLCSVPLAHIVLTRLVGVIDTVRDGDPFVSGNARRLAHMAWALLGLEVLHLLSIAVAIGASDEAHGFDWSFSVTGWLAVLLLLVLARVFEHGARMREELEGVV